MVLAASVDYCYSDIGCFPLSDEFYHPKHRPFNVRPWHRQHIRTQFELFNKHHPEGFMMLPWNRKNLELSRFDPRLETKIIVPGWLDNINRAVWVKKLKDALLYLWVPVNIIVVRWTNFTPYTIATANTRVVGAELANWMKFIERELAYDPAYYHIIGHSLGAHIAGYCGDRVHGLGRITALDPARPFFQHMPKSVRLDRSDAKFVDAIHSDFTPENAVFLLMSYGMTTPVGHLDFYPNGPPLYQPGCIRDTLLSVQNGIARGLRHNSLSVAFLESIRYLTACDHQRSHEWFIESITNRECAFVGVRCNEFEGMINGRCTCDDSPSACAIMGIHADQMFLHNVHEELWPVRAGSIDFKYREPPPSRVRPHWLAPPPSQPLPAALLDSGPPETAYGLDLDDLDGTVEHNYNMLSTAALLNQQQQQHHHHQASLVHNLQHQQMQHQPETEPAQARPPVTKDEIYAHLKQQAMQMHNKGEPSIAPTMPVVYRDQVGTTSEGALLASAYSQASGGQQETTYHDASTQYDVYLEPPAGGQAGDQMSGAPSDTEQTLDEHMSALDDAAFAGYLRTQLLLSQLDDIEGAQGKQADAQNSTSGPSSSSLDDNDAADSEQDDQLADRKDGAAGKIDKRTAKTKAESRHHQEATGHPDQYGGHPLTVSGVNRDIESWYEDNGRWHLKTNNQPKYCSNQYQLLIFLGPLKSSRGRERLRADLLVSIVGSRGQLLNQRFVPRGSSLTAFTMQPFFILLEGSYSLGQIKSVALSWEARRDPDPVQATISFQSSELQALGENLAIYKAKQFPWLPEETKYDKSAGFTHRHMKRPQEHAMASSSSSALHSTIKVHPPSIVSGNPPHKFLQGASPDAGSAAAAALYKLRYREPSMSLKSVVSGHYSQKYAHRKADGNDLRRRSDEITADTSLTSTNDDKSSPLKQDTSPTSVRIVSSNARAQPQAGSCSIQTNTGCRASRTRRFDTMDEPANSLETEEDLAATPSKLDYYHQDDEQDELQQQVDELLQLKQVNQQQREEILLATGQAAPSLDDTPDQPPTVSSMEQLAKSQVPNQTYLVVQPADADLPHHGPIATVLATEAATTTSTQATPTTRMTMHAETTLKPYSSGHIKHHLAGDLNVDTADPYFVRLVDPIDETASYKPSYGIKPMPEHDKSHEGKVTIDLHNAHITKNSDEDSIVVNQVIVSPLQASYGRHGRNAKTFCPPLTKQKLTRDVTVKLSLSMLSTCGEHHHHQEQMKMIHLVRQREQSLVAAAMQRQPLVGADGALGLPLELAPISFI